MWFYRYIIFITYNEYKQVIAPAIFHQLFKNLRIEITYM